MSTVDHGAGVVCFSGSTDSLTVLLVQMNYGTFKGHWILPGGLLEAGEHPHAAAIREFKEETNLSVRIEKLIGVRHRIEKSGKVNTYWVFLGQLDPKTLVSQLHWNSEELVEVKFWKIDEALKSEAVRPHTKRYIQAALDPEKNLAFEKLESAHTDYFYPAHI